MRRILVLAAALAWVVVATEARGDMVYLTDGQGVWGKDVYEEGDWVVVERPGGSLRFPKGQVNRIERTRSSLPPFYTPPEGAPATPSAPAGPAGAPGAPGTPGQPGAPPASPGARSPSGSGAGSSRATTPPSTGPTALPPAPAPPPPGGSSQ